MSEKIDIPMDKVGSKTLNVIAAFHWGGKVIVGLAISVIAVFGAWASHKSAGDSKKYANQIIAQSAEVKTELRIERERRTNLERELASVRVEMDRIIERKDEQIAKLTDEVEMLRSKLDKELSKWRARETELVERIAKLKLEDGKPNSFE